MLKDYLIIQSLVKNVLDSPGMGGNISVKSKNKILVKASGEDLKKDHNVVCFKDDKFLYSRNTASDKTKVYLKPTMEFGFHKKIKSKYVLHYHPIYALPHLCSHVTYRSNLMRYIDYCTPGDELTHVINTNAKSGIFMLRNHGIIIYADDIGSVEYLYNRVKEIFFDDHDTYYTPDDAVDSKNDELWLFRNAMENIANKKNIKLYPLSDDMIQSLLNNEDEKYRMKVKT